MSGAHAPKPAEGGGQTDPSMEDILASIRRILSEDEKETAAPAGSHAADDDDVLALEPSMMVTDPTEPPAPPTAVPHAAAPHAPGASATPAPPPATVAAVAAPPAPHVPPAQASVPAETLIAPEAAAAAASSVGSLLRTLAAERHPVAVHRGGPTLEDLVREEMRPLLKAWLDANLPTLVERLVRAEIDRVVGRALT